MQTLHNFNDFYPFVLLGNSSWWERIWSWKFKTLLWITNRNPLSWTLICTYTIHSFKTTKWIYRTCFHLALQYVKEVFPEHYLALQFDCPMANFVSLLWGKPHKPQLIILAWLEGHWEPCTTRLGFKAQPST